jgi:hypothetical protein
MENIDLEKQIQEENTNQNQEQLTQEENQQPQENNLQNKNIIDALDKEIERRKQKLSELSNSIKNLKNDINVENESVINLLRKEGLDEALKRVSAKYSLTEEDKNLIRKEIETKYRDAISAEKIEKIASAVYFIYHPEKLEEVETALKNSTSKILNKTEEDISSGSEYEPSEKGNLELTPEEMELARKYNINPQAFIKMKKQKSEPFLSKNSKKQLI